LSKTTTTEKVRAYTLAKELKLETKDLLELCKELGYDSVKNQLSGVEPEQVVGLKKRLKEGPKAAPQTPVAPPKPAMPVAPPKVLDTKIRTIAPAKPKVAKPGEADEPAGEPPAPAAEEAPAVVPEAPAEPVAAEAAPETPVAPPAAPVAPPITVGPPPASMMPSQLPTQSRGVQNLLNPNRMPSVGSRSPQPLRPSGSAPNRPTTTPPVVAPPVAQHPQPPAAAPATTVPPANPPKPAGAPMNMPQRQNPGAPPNLGGPPRGTNPQAPGAGPAQPPRSVNPFQRPQRPGAMPPRNPMAGGNPMQARPPAAPGAPGAKPAAAPPAPGKSMKLTLEQIKKLREMEQKRGKVTMEQVQKQIADPQPAATDKKDASGRPVRTTTARTDDAGESEEDKKKKLPGAVAGRDGRHASRQGRDRRGNTDKGAVIIGAGGQVDLIEQAAGSRRGPRAALIAKMKRRSNQQVVKKEGPVEIALPITVRSLSEAIGMKVGDLSKQLLAETQKLYGINSAIDFDVAEVVAINKGITLVAKKVMTAEDLLLEGFEKRAREVDPELLRPRPPVVTIMGHVDHGKTSLLDQIRAQYGHESNVVDTEAGGITQVLRAWRVEKDGKPVTFLDTPGHEAFTMMRARGAKVTDIVVIVVAATDGVMPQTEEAINHALAADVEIIVAINKIDMPNANIDKTRRQLYQLNLLPDDMGGDIQFVETSAVTGQGVGDLLDAIGIVAELADPPYRADPSHPASGTCLEAYLDADHGVMATLLVQQGTLHKGDVILCGSSHGRVRAMFDDLGQAIEEAGPSMPVKVLGLNPVPDADDPFYFVDDIGVAAGIAGKRADRQRERSLVNLSPKSLDQLKEANAKTKITELKIILKAEARGSVEAIKRELEKLTHEEVRTRILHAGIGAISESDVTLALTSPQDTLVIGFNVTADDAALRLAKERGISLDEYDIIYKLVEDVTAALEGRLKPIEEVVHLGRAVVRESFRITKVGVVAGCYVTQGVIERNARVRVIRDGTVIYPPSEKTLGLESLKRFKDDAKEVKEGYECGMKIVGFEDVKVGDVIEAFRIDTKMRKL
jgi:translation initiation factor IF-2